MFPMRYVKNMATFEPEIPEDETPYAEGLSTGHAQNILGHIGDSYDERSLLMKLERALWEKNSIIEELTAKTLKGEEYSLVDHLGHPSTRTIPYHYNYSDDKVTSRDNWKYENAKYLRENVALLERVRAVFERGNFFSTDKRIFAEEKDGRSLEERCVNYYLQHKKTNCIVMGFARKENNTWWPHMWLLGVDEPVLVELQSPSSSYIEYLGFSLRDDEARFLAKRNNISMQKYKVKYKKSEAGEA